jgi:REP element-mobilizing transposase RayT
MYFVTICTHERTILFDNPATRRVVELALLSVGRYCRPASVDEFVVMPNHVHAIIRIAATHAVGASAVPVGAQRTPGAESPRLSEVDSSAENRPDYACAAPLPTRARPRRVEPGSLGALIRAFKSSTTKRINAIRNANGIPVWQRNFYEHIIRSEDDLMRIRQYIRDNPAKWAEDPDNPANIPPSCDPPPPP